MNLALDFQKFVECLKEAAAKMEEHYFRLPVAGAQKPMIRERVYCYELYHQLRLALPDDFPYKLHGEVDKISHPNLERSLGSARKPDFIVHVPGTGYNLVVIEVKPVVPNNIAGIREDLKILQRFLEVANYYRAIMLLYGDGRNALRERVVSELNRLCGESTGRMLLVWHKSPEERPEVVQTGAR